MTLLPPTLLDPGPVEALRAHNSALSNTARDWSWGDPTCPWLLPPTLLDPGPVEALHALTRLTPTLFEPGPVEALRGLDSAPSNTARSWSC